LIVQHPEEDWKGEGVWGGGSVIHVNSKGTTLQVGLKEEKKIIWQVK